MLYYHIYYFQIICYFFGFVLSQSLRNSQTLGRFFDPLYKYLLMHFPSPNSTHAEFISPIPGFKRPVADGSGGA